VLYEKRLPPDDLRMAQALQLFCSLRPKPEVLRIIESDTLQPDSTISFSDPELTT
jgi:hypothetical protein